MLQDLRNFAFDTEGTTAIDYALIAVLLGLALIGIFSDFAGDVGGLFDAVSVDVAEAASSVR